MKLRIYANALAWMQATAAMRSADNVHLGPASWCFTYMSDILVPAPTLSLASGTTFLTTSTVTQASIPASLNSLIPTTGTLATTSFSGTSTTVASSPTPNTPTVRQVILFISPSPGTGKRNLKTRASQGFLGNDASANQQRCDNAAVFALSSGQLSVGGVPIHYSPGDNYTQLRNTGPLTEGAITTTFTDNGGVLQFSNSALPSGRADFCEDATGHVYMTFASSPLNCEPVLVSSYTGKRSSLNPLGGNVLTIEIVEQCLNGQIDGAGFPSSASTQTNLPSVSNGLQSSSITISRTTTGLFANMTSSESTSSSEQSSSSTSIPAESATSLSSSLVSGTIPLSSTSTTEAEATSQSSSSSETGSTTSSSAAQEITSSTSGTPSATSLLFCRQGLEYAAYFFDSSSAQCAEISRTYRAGDPLVMNLTTVIQGQVPSGTGQTQLNEWTDYNSTDLNGPVTIYDHTSPPGTNVWNTCSVIQYRGYLNSSEPGVYTVRIDFDPDDVVYFWFSDLSFSGRFSPQYSHVRKLKGADLHASTLFMFGGASSTVYYPIRILYGNLGGPGNFNLSISFTSEFSRVSCVGVKGAPDWLPWEQELVGTDPFLK